MECVIAMSSHVLFVYMHVRVWVYMCYSQRKELLDFCCKNLTFGRRLGFYVCMYTNIHTYTHTYIHTYVHTYIHTYSNMVKKGRSGGFKPVFSLSHFKPFVLPIAIPLLCIYVCTTLVYSLCLLFGHYHIVCSYGMVCMWWYRL